MAYEAALTYGPGREKNRHTMERVENVYGEFYENV